jgi:hypothetical protein
MLGVEGRSSSHNNESMPGDFPARRVKTAHESIASDDATAKLLRYWQGTFDRLVALWRLSR